MSINILDFQNDITAKAKSCSIYGMDWQDISQELYLHLLKNAYKYNPDKGAGQRTFIVRVITNKIRDLVRHINAQKRYLDTHSLSLDELREQELIGFYENE